MKFLKFPLTLCIYTGLEKTIKSAFKILFFISCASSCLSNGQNPLLKQFAHANQYLILEFLGVTISYSTSTLLSTIYNSSLIYFNSVDSV